MITSYRNLTDSRTGEGQQRHSRRSFMQSCLVALPAADMIHSLASSEARGFKLGIIADEIADDLAQALEFIAAHSLHYCELREIWQSNMLSLTPSQLDRARELVQRYQLRVSAIASPIFKYALPGTVAKPDNPLLFHSAFTDKDSPRLLRRAFEVAQLFGTSRVRVFSFWRVSKPEDVYQRVRDRLGLAAELAKRNGITLMLENEYDTNIATAGELGRILHDINSPCLRANWDPGNDAMMNEVPYPDGHQKLKGLIAHLHIKDVKRNTRSGQLSWAAVGSGLIDWRGQLLALRQEGYQGTMSLETHYRPSGDALATAQESLAGLMRIIHELG